MKAQATFAAICAAILMLTLSLTASPAQNAPSNPSQQAPATADKSYEGHLSKVDISAKLITVRGADDKEMMFVYNEQTQMVGVDNSPQGLTGKTGSNLKVVYRENRGINLATRIEVVQQPTR